jgi:DNA-binding transcriptional MerR regulator
VVEPRNSEGTLYDLTELCDLSTVTPRTVRYYIQQGLLPSPGQFGPGAKYNTGHLNRLKLIRQLQRAHLPLAEIRRRLHPLSDGAVAVRLAEEPARTTSSAVDYVRAALASSAVPFAPAATPAGEPQRVVLERSQWERVPLDDDVELHVRRPLSRDQNRRVERLLDAGRRIFEEEP